MATCATCGSTILFGGARLGEFRFCNSNCLARGRPLTIARDIPDNILTDLARRIHSGQCPTCQGPGPVDVHKAFSVWSAIAMTSWKTQPVIACQSCGTKAQVRALLFSTLLGWWGCPWGLLVTPMQIARNISALTRRPDPLTPSPELLRAARIHIATQAVAQAEAKG